MDVEIWKQRIQEELKDCKSGLTVSDRRLLSTFLGYLPIEGIRDKKKDWEVSPIYVRSNLFPYLTKRQENGNSSGSESDEKGIEAETKPFSMSEIDFWNEKYFPSIFKRDEQSVTKTLMEEGVGLNSIEECSLIRTFQVSFFFKKRTPDRRKRRNLKKKFFFDFL